MKKQQTVFVGLSGGVDSSVAAARLKARGFNVVGVFIKVWHPDFMVCNWEAERLDAMRVAAHLDIPFLTCDAEAEYREDVAKYFIEEYKAGRTPNPDVMCNKQVKFGAFLRFAKEKGADFIATGHYAQRLEPNKKTPKGNPSEFEMHRGVDSNKDQTYFLWTLTDEQLACSLFPVGDTSKEEIRKEAEALGIPTASKKDSQGICFLGHVDIHEFLSHYIELENGNVLNEEGEIIGTHNGALVYTLGQRHGFTLETLNPNREPMFVTGKDLRKNTITVSNQRTKTTKSTDFSVNNSILRTTINVGDTFEAQFRYRQKPFYVTVTDVNEESFSITVNDEVETPAIGQSCVLYKDSLCVGGGILS